MHGKSAAIFFDERPDVRRNFVGRIVGVSLSGGVRERNLLSALTVHRRVARLPDFLPILRRHVVQRLIFPNFAGLRIADFELFLHLDVHPRGGWRGLARRRRAAAERASQPVEKALGFDRLETGPAHGRAFGNLRPAFGATHVHVVICNFRRRRVQDQIQK